MSYVSDVSLDEPLTRARWLNEKTLIAATTHGNLFVVKIEKDDQNRECLARPHLIYSSEHAVAIWDVAFHTGGEHHEVWIAEDSGKIVSIALDLQNLLVTRTILVQVSPAKPTNCLTLSVLQQFSG